MNSNEISRDVRGGRILILVLTAPLCFSHVASALEFNYNVGYRLEFSDNVARTATNEVDEQTNVATAGFSLQENNSTVEARIAASAEYDDYKNNTFSDRSVLNLNALTLWKLWPERFTWTIEDYYTQTVIDTFSAVTPGNSQDVNVFSTGPDFYLRFGPVHRLQLGARYAEDSYEAVDLDSTRETAFTKWLYLVSPVTTLSLNYDVGSVDFDNEVLNSNFDRRDMSLGIINRISKNEILLNLGRTSIRRDRADDVDGRIEQFSWKRQLTLDSDLTLLVSSTLSDVGQSALIAGQTQSISNISTNSVSSDVFKAKTAGVNYTRKRAYGNNSIRVSRTERTFALSTVNDLTARGVDASIGYDFSTTFSSSLSGSYVKTSYPQVPRDDKDEVLVILFQHRPSRNLSLNFELKRLMRDSTDVGFNYKERVAILSLIYNRRHMINR